MAFEFDRKYAYLHNQEHIETLFENELDFMPPRNYCFRDLARIRRKFAVDILEKHADIGDADEDLLLPYLALSYFDRYSSIHPLCNRTRRNIEFFTICCLVLASKMRSENFNYTDFMGRHQLNHDVEDVMKEELRILQNLEWRMLSVTGFSFVHYFVFILKITDKDMKYKLTKKAFQNVGKIYLGDIKFLRFRPSIIAAASVLASSSWSCYVKRAIVTEEHVNRDDLGACSAEIAQQLTDYAVETPLIIQPPSLNLGDASACVDTDAERLIADEGSAKTESPQSTRPPNSAPGDDLVAVDNEILNLGEESTNPSSAQRSPCPSSAHGSVAEYTESLNLGVESTSPVSLAPPTQFPSSAPSDAANMGKTRYVLEPPKPLILASDISKADIEGPEETTTVASGQLTPSLGPGGIADTEVQELQKDSSKSAPDDAPDYASTGNLNTPEGSTESATPQPTPPHGFAPGDALDAPDTEELVLSREETKSPPSQPTQPPISAPGPQSPHPGDESLKTAQAQSLNLGPEDSMKPASPKHTQRIGSALGDASAATEEEKLNLGEDDTKSEAGQSVFAPEDASESAQPPKGRKRPRKQKKALRSFYS